MLVRKGLLDLKLECYNEYVLITNYSYMSPLFGIGTVNKALKNISECIGSEKVQVIIDMSHEDINSNVRFFKLRYNKKKNEIELDSVINCSKDDLPKSLVKTFIF